MLIGRILCRVGTLLTNEFSVNFRAWKVNGTLFKNQFSSHLSALRLIMLYLKWLLLLMTFFKKIEFTLRSSTEPLCFSLLISLQKQNIYYFSLSLACPEKLLMVHDSAHNTSPLLWSLPGPFRPNLSRFSLCFYISLCLSLLCRLVRCVGMNRCPSGLPKQTVSPWSQRSWYHSSQACSPSILAC